MYGCLKVLDQSDPAVKSQSPEYRLTLQQMRLPRPVVCIGVCERTNSVVFGFGTENIERWGGIPDDLATSTILDLRSHITHESKEDGEGSDVIASHSSTITTSVSSSSSSVTSTIPYFVDTYRCRSVIPVSLEVSSPADLLLIADSYGAVDIVQYSSMQCLRTLSRFSSLVAGYTPRWDCDKQRFVRYSVRGHRSLDVCSTGIMDPSRLVGTPLRRMDSVQPIDDIAFLKTEDSHFSVSKDDDEKNVIFKDPCLIFGQTGVHLWDLDNGRHICTLIELSDHKLNSHCFALSCHRTMIACSLDGCVQVWYFEHPSVLFHLANELRVSEDLEFEPGSGLASLEAEEEENEEKEIRGTSAKSRILGDWQPWLEFHPRIDRFLLGWHAFQMRVWDVLNGMCVFKKTIIPTMWSCRWGPRGNYVISGVADGTVQFHRFATIMDDRMLDVICQVWIRQGQICGMIIADDDSDDDGGKKEEDEEKDDDKSGVISMPEEMVRLIGTFC